MNNHGRSPDFTNTLLQLMEQRGIASYAALGLAAGVSKHQVQNLRQGHLPRMRLETLLRLSQALQIPIADLITHFSPTAPPPQQAVDALRQEYDRLQAQLENQRQDLWQEFQQSSLQVLESLLLQLPTAAYAAQQNPQAPAVKLLPLLRPIDALLQQWGIEAIAAVGAEIPYDPQQHQLMEGAAQPGDRVRVRYTGYRQGDRLLYRARVSAV